MLSEVAYTLSFGSVLLAGWALGAFAVGGFRAREAWTASGTRAMQALFASVVFCSTAVIVATLTDDFRVSYVAKTSSLELPTVYKFTAFWSGMDGSMLLWLLLLSGFAVLSLGRMDPKHRHLRPFVGLVFAGLCLFFCVLIAFVTNPLEALDFVPLDGTGMNPQLQNYWMAIHPPALYLGYVGLSVPFAYAVAALLAGRLDAGWIHAVRRWMLLAWAALGIGMILGGRWAYEELGWGGFWAWDPVENASFMPWLMATAFLHSVLIQERRGMFKVWNLLLVISAFGLSIFGTFLTRSGIVESVHAFARSEVGDSFLILVVVTMAGSIALVHYRLPMLRSEHRIESLVSREFSFMLNNLLFATTCATTLLLTMWPSLSEYFTGERFSIGTPGFNLINGSLGLALLVLTGIGPVISWRRASLSSLRRGFLQPVLGGLAVAVALFASGFRDPMTLVAFGGAAFVVWVILSEFHRGAQVLSSKAHGSYLRGLVLLVSRNRRRYGGYIVHLAVAMFFIGIAGMAYQERNEAHLAEGESMTVHGYEITHAGPVSYRGPGSDVYSVSLLVTRDGKDVCELRPEYKIHDKFPEPERDIDRLQTFSGDLYTILAQPVREGDAGAKVQVFWNPLIAWIWWAGYLMLAGTLVCAWPRAEGKADSAPLTASS